MSGGVPRAIKLPGCLRAELLDYARREGISSGPLFAARTGKALNRTRVTGCIQALSPRRPGGAREVQPPVPAQTVPLHHSRPHGQCPDSGGAEPRAAAGEGTAGDRLGDVRTASNREWQTNVRKGVRNMKRRAMAVFLSLVMGTTLLQPAVSLAAGEVGSSGDDQGVDVGDPRRKSDPKIWIPEHGP